MGKPVQIRVHYRDDSAYLLRLETAVRKDTRQTEAWRQETATLLRQAVTKLIEATAEVAPPPQGEPSAKV